MVGEINYWSELDRRCPVDLSRIINYSKSFESYMPDKITLNNLDSSKKALFDSRSSLDSMITSLIQILYSREFLEKETDKILFAWLVDNLGRFMKKMDELEEHLIVKFDEPTNESRVGISRLSSYMKILRTASDSLIYECLFKATQEYNDLKETKDTKETKETKKTKGSKETKKIKKEPRTFLYILFHILQVTLSVLGGLSREKTGVGKKGIVHNIPLSWQSLMGNKGQEIIRKGYQDDTGVDVRDFEEDLSSLDEEPLVEGDIDENSN